MKKILVTGAAGFIGSCFVRQALHKNYSVVILDALTYAGRLENLAEILNKPGIPCEFIHGSINDFELLNNLFTKHQFSAIFNFAAESHVDNSISGPKAFIETNINGTFTLLEAARGYWSQASEEYKKQFRFIHVSTDEVYGELGSTGHFTEKSPYLPNSPYSSSKASSDLLVRAWNHTYKLPTIITNCSNNYGPRQFPEKLIPRMITCALKEEFLPVYGQGANIRDWIHVEDHSRGVLLAYENGQPGETYCFGGNSERNNLQVVKEICRILDEIKPRKNGASYSELIRFVEDRKGHDFRYAIDDSKAQEKLGFKREYASFEQGLIKTVQWYLSHLDWVDSVSKQVLSK